MRLDQTPRETTGAGRGILVRLTGWQLLGDSLAGGKGRYRETGELSELAKSVGRKYSLQPVPSPTLALGSTFPKDLCAAGLCQGPHGWTQLGTELALSPGPPQCPTRPGTL